MVRTQPYPYCLLRDASDGWRRSGLYDDRDDREGIDNPRYRASSRP